METLQLIPFEEMFHGPVIGFGPTLEPFDTEGVFLNANVFDLIENSWSDDFPFMIGQCSMETLTMVPTLQANPELFASFANFENYVPLELGKERNTEKSRRLTRQKVKWSSFQSRNGCMCLL